MTALLLTSACTVRVTGHTSPIAHDYGGVEWRPLEEVVEQSFVAGPGQQAAIANDPETTPAQLQERLANLPKDARTGRLEEILVGLRLAGERGVGGSGRWETGARIQVVSDPAHDLRFPEREFAAWPADEVWLPEGDGGVIASQTFVSPYALLAGISLRVATFGGDLSPGEAIVGPDGAELRGLPLVGEVVGALDAGARVHVTSASEGWASVELADGQIGWAPLTAFASLPEPARRLAHPVTVTLADESGTELRRVTVEPAAIHDNAHLFVRFEPLADSAGTRYTFTVAVPDSAGQADITLRATTSDRYFDGAASTGDDLVFRPLYDEEAPLLDVAVDDLPRDGDWLRIDDPPDLEAGQVVSLRLVPGDGADARRMHYGVTSDRVPYGGWAANGADGALLLRTTYHRNVELWPVVKDGIGNLRAGLRSDLLFAGGWLLALSGLLLAAGRLGWPRRTGSV